MRISRIICMLFLPGFLFAGFVCSQDKSSNNKNVEKKPIEVKVNLMVLDSAGNTDNDLKPEDLKVFEDGVEQKIAKITKKNSFNVGIVIDRSGSVRTQLDIIADTAKLIVNNLREKDEAFVVSFVDSENVNIEQTWTSDKIMLNAAISNIFIEGGRSAVLDAIYLSAAELKKKTDESQRNALILISDCDDRDSYYSLKEVIRSLKENNVEVYVLAFTKELPQSNNLEFKSRKQQATDLAEDIASQSRGMAFSPKWSTKKQDEITEAAKAIIFELRSQYTIEYRPTSQKRGERKIVVEVANNAKGEKRSVFMREKIFVPKD